MACDCKSTNLRKSKRKRRIEASDLQGCEIVPVKTSMNFVIFSTTLIFFPFFFFPGFLAFENTTIFV